MLQMTDGRLLTIIRIIKSVLVLENGLIPPNVNFEKVNPKIPAAKWRLQFPLKPTPWPTDGLRRISVNSFGVGGTNGHVVIDDAYHYLRERGLTANHYTQPSAPTSADLGFVNGNDSQAVDGSEIVNGHTNGLTDGNGNGLTNGHAHDLANGHVNGLTNGNENGLYNGHANSITNGNVNGLIGENANGAEVNNAAHTLNGTRVDSPTGEIQPQLTSGLVNRSKVELTGDWKAFDPVECFR
jgi:hypothetical protein